MGFREYIDEAINIYEPMLAGYENQITQLNPPRLRLYVGLNGRTYSRVYYAKPDRRRRSKKITLEEALRIQRNHFCIRMVKILKKNLKLLYKCRKDFIEPDPAEIMAGMAPAYHIMGPLPTVTDQPAPAAKAPPLPAGSKKQQSDKQTARILTADGTLVKSRIEALIYNALLASGLEFRYEFPITLSGIVYRPDFTIWLPNGKVIYWEHLGLLVQGGYRSEQQAKLKAYFEHHITVGINLILTADDIDKSVDTQAIAEIIRGLQHMAGMVA